MTQVGNPNETTFKIVTPIIKLKVNISDQKVEKLEIAKFEFLNSKEKLKN